MRWKRFHFQRPWKGCGILENSVYCSECWKVSRLAGWGEEAEIPPYKSKNVLKHSIPSYWFIRYRNLTAREAKSSMDSKAGMVQPASPGRRRAWRSVCMCWTCSVTFSLIFYSLTISRHSLLSPLFPLERLWYVPQGVYTKRKQPTD